MDILLYTTDRLLADLLRIALGGTYRVRGAATERRLFAALASGRVGAVVLDGTMGDAAELCLRLRAMKAVPLIAIARGDEAAEQVRLLRAGAEEALARSFKLADLVARLYAKLRPAEIERRRCRLVVEAKALC
jgi:DNA-binding response OmpR family regulator